VLTPDQAEVWYKRLGWPPELAHQVAQAFGKATSAATKEATAADLTTLYDGGKMTEAETLAALEALDYPADEAQRKIDLVAARRVIASKNSAITDLHGAYKKQDLNALNATNALLALGLDADTAAKMVANWQQYVTAVATAPTPPPV
jgi:Holliday junction resolvasome RuvABC DNA-binding subunit